MKLCIASDNHWNMNPLYRILEKCNDADYYFLLGDSEFYPDEIKPFVSVEGNNDIYNLYPKMRIFEYQDYRILLTHGHFHQIHLGLDGLKKEAIKNNCNIVLFGHTHRFLDKEEDGIRFINPSSCRYNRDGSKPAYVELYLDKEIIVKRVELE